MKLNGTHQLLAYADDVNILGGSIRTVKENAEAVVVATKETGIEVNADKTKYKVMSREQTAELSHTMKVDNTNLCRNILVLQHATFKFVTPYCICEFVFKF